MSTPQTAIMQMGGSARANIIATPPSRARASRPQRALTLPANPELTRICRLSNPAAETHPRGSNARSCVGTGK